MTHTPLTKAEREELRRLHDYASGRFTMRINGENDCRVELANGPSDDERGLHARFRYATGAHAFVAIHNHLPRLLADIDAAEAERDERSDEARELRSVLLRHNFAPCDTAACNCNGWHERSTGNGFYARFREIDEAVGDHNGKTLLKAVQEIVAQRDRAESELDAERKMRGEAEAAAKRAEDARDALKAKLAAAESAHSELFLSGQVAELRGKLAALVEAVSSAETILGNMAKETGRVFGRWEINHEPLRNDAQRMLPSFRAAIAAARGGAQ